MIPKAVNKMVVIHTKLFGARAATTPHSKSVGLRWSDA